MPPLKTINLQLPLRDVCLLPALSVFQADAARRQAEREAYERGRQDGERALSAQLLEQRNELLELQRGIFASLREAVGQIVHQTEGHLLELALAAAQKINAGLEISRELVERVVKEAVSEVEDGAEITVQLHPEDLALLRKHQSPLLQGLPDAGPLRFVSALEVTRGGCMVQTRFGTLDARRETKLEQLRAALIP